MSGFERFADAGEHEPRERGRVSRRQEQAIAALLAQPTIAEAAKSIGVGESTLRRWLGEPAFREAYRTARRQAVEVAIGTLQQAGAEAVTTLRRNMSETTPPAVQVRAAVAILEHAARGVELLDLAERVAALEESARQEHEP